ncbi:MAG: ATP-binding protein [Fimbriimonadales bacterium]
MKFRQLALEGYGRFRERAVFELEAGLNIIHGGNETGKSTLLQALLDALYTLPASVAQATRERIHWGHPNGWTLELALELRDAPIRIRKFHPVDEPRKRAEFTLHIGETVYSGDAARAQWEQLWQIPQEVYLTTACIRQRELTQLAQRHLKSLQQQLRASAVNADLNRVLTNLQQERRRLRQQIESQQSAVAAIRARLETAQNTAHQRRRLRAQLQQAVSEAEQLRVQLAQEEQLLQRWHAARSAQERLERLRREAGANQRHLDQLEQLERRVRELEGELEAQFGAWRALSDDFKAQVDAAYLRYRDAARRLHALQVSAERERAARLQMRGRAQARRGFAILGGALTLAGAALWGVSPLLGAIAFALGITALSIALLWRRQPRPTTTTEPALQHAQTETRTHWQTLADLLHTAGYTLETPPTNGVAEQNERLAHLMQQISEQWNARQSKRAELDATRRQIDALHAVQDPKALRERQRELAVEILGLQEQLQREPLAREGLSAEGLIRLEAQVERERQRLTELQAEQLRCEGALASLPESEPADAVALELERAEQRLQQMRYRHQLLETTEQLLSEANAQYLSRLSPHLKPRIEAHLPTLTLGRYTHAELDDTLRLSVYHPERGETLVVEEAQPAWSAGVLDQLYFACRLGLADALADSVRLPLLLDDPFVHFDAERYRAALELLVRIAEQTQVILFTCRALPAGAWGRVVDLS